MPIPQLQAGLRQPTEVAGVHSVIGQVQPAAGGWSRCDRIFIGTEEIGSVQVREHHERISSVSQCGDAAVIGRDVDWIVRRSGKPLPPTPVPEGADAHFVRRRARP